MVHPLAAFAQTDVPALFRAGLFDDVRAACEARLSTAPDDPEALYFLARLTEDLGASDRMLQRVVDEHPQHPLADDALFALAESAYAGPFGLYLKARRRYAQLVQTYPASPHVPMSLYRIGLTHLIVREVDVAEASFQHVVDNHPTSSAAFRAHLGLAEVEAARGNQVRAVAIADSIAASAPDSLKTLVTEHLVVWKRRTTADR